MFIIMCINIIQKIIRTRDRQQIIFAYEIYLFYFSVLCSRQFNSPTSSSPRYFTVYFSEDWMLHALILFFYPPFFRAMFQIFSHVFGNVWDAVLGSELLNHLHRACSPEVGRSVHQGYLHVVTLNGCNSSSRVLLNLTSNPLWLSAISSVL